MKVVLAEKPSVARDIAQVLGANQKKDGYYEGNDYIVTYTFGHLVTIAEPEEMNAAWGKPWRFEQLPMIPAAWKYRILAKAESQFKVIRKLFSLPTATTIICATDAGREGEHIFRLVYKLSGCKKPVQRLWISSLTSEAIKDGFRKLKSSTEFDNLANAATARAHADWLVGLNFTRAYTKINHELCTIGRVQTPTLALIVARQEEIDKFKSTPFYEVIATFEPGFIARYITPGQDPKSRLEDKATAEAILSSVTPITTGTVISIVTIEKRTKAPPLFDLLTLQREANKRFGYTAQETLDIAQSLYEQFKLISYPRTESRHLSTDMIEELPGILSAVLSAPTVSDSVRELFSRESIEAGKVSIDQIRPRLNKSYIDNTKLTDHHAIIPTHKVAPRDLPQKQKSIYQLIANRFLSIFLPAEIRDETTAIIALGDHKFRARGVVIKDPGWTALEPKASPEKERGQKEKGRQKEAETDPEKDKDTDDLQQLPPLVKNDNITKRSAELKSGKTNPPKPYTDSTLLAAMKNAGQELNDEDLASYMKQSGLGTPSTRAAIIERLLQSNYIERNKKALLPTTKGRILIEQVHGDLKDIGLTASWEQRLAEMQDGKLALPTFEADIAQFVCRVLPKITEIAKKLPPDRTHSQTKHMPSREIDSHETVEHTRALEDTPRTQPRTPRQKGNKTDPGLKSSDHQHTKSKPPGSFGLCPQCKDGHLQATPKAVGCSRWRDGCQFTIWRTQYGKELTDSMIKTILSKKRSQVIKGFKTRDGANKYDGTLVLTDDFKVRMEPSGSGETVFGQCPQCKQGSIRKTMKGAGCDRWKEGCSFSIWRVQYGKELTDSNIDELVKNGRTGTIKGFKKLSGEGTYNARLIVTDQFKVRLEFGE